MTETELQNLIQDQTQTIPDTDSLLQSALEPLMPLLSLLLVAAVVLSVVIVLYFVVNTIQKQRQHKAIMRIDQNLQRLVDAQFAKSAPLLQEQQTDSNTAQ